MSDQLSAVDVMFDRIIDLANTRIGKVITYGITVVAGIYISGNLFHLLAAFTIGLKTFVAAMRNPI